MGAVTFSLDVRLVECLKAALPLSVFVETGTFKGDTVANLAGLFERLISVEFSEPLWKEARERFQSAPHVEIHLGNSPEVLTKLQPALQDAAVLYWLDAHWCVAQNTAGDRSQCPLLGEIGAIGNLNASSVLLIDDARLFMAPPLPPHDIDQWPSFDAIVRALHALSDQHELMIVNDVIALYPRSVAAQVTQFARTCGVDWLEVAPYLNPDNNLVRILQEKEAVIVSQHALLQQQLQDIRRKADLIDNKVREIESFRVLFFFFGPFLRPLKGISGVTYRATKPRLGSLNQYPPAPWSIAPYKGNGLTSWPRISIVTPSFRQGAFIERTMQSVLAQNYPNLEYRVQDGGSTDGTVELLERYADRLTGWESRSDSGQSQAINRGFAETAGDIMAWLNSDDLLLPGALACVGEYFASHPEIDVVYGHRLLIDENDQQIGRWMMPSHSDETLSWADYVPQETLFWRRSAWEKAGGKIDESFRFAMDWDFLVRLRDSGARFARLPRFLGGFRIHPEQKTSSIISEVGIEEMNRIRLRTLGRIPTEAEMRKAMRPFLLRHVATDMAWRARQKFGLD